MGEQSSPGPADRGALVGLVFGHMAAQTVAAAARLGVAEAVARASVDGPADSAVVAVSLGTDAVATERMLRALAAVGVVAEPEPGRFGLTGVGELLRPGQPGSMESFVRMFLDPVMIESWAHLDESVRSGATSFDEVFGTDFFAYLARDPVMSERFNRSMQQGTRLTAQVLPDVVDLSGASTVADLGGGDGTLLAAILTAHPHLRGVLYDTPEGAAEAGSVLAAAGVADRCTVRHGDFFVSAPEGADVYLLKSVVHDWDDDRVRLLLGHVRRVIPSSGRLLIVEPILPERVDGAMSPMMYLSDLNMLVNVGGKERKEAQFRALCRAAGFSVRSVTPLPAPAAMSVIEATPDE